MNLQMKMKAFAAMAFAREAHAGQRRKYTGNPYTDHLAEVAGIVVTVCPRMFNWDTLVAIAWLHDTMEDCGVTYKQLELEFGPTIAYAVLQLSDLEEGNRAERKAAARTRLAAAWPWVQTIKVADFMSNTASIVQHDPKFAVTYLDEMSAMLRALPHADPSLVRMARVQLAAGRSALGIEEQAAV